MARTKGGPNLPPRRNGEHPAVIGRPALGRWQRGRSSSNEDARPPPWLPPAVLAILVVSLANLCFSFEGAPGAAAGRRRMERSMAAEMIEGGGIGAYDLGRTRSMAVIMEQNETWPAYEGKHRFEECVNKTIAQCQTLVDSYVSANTEQFNNRTTLRLEPRKIREITDASSYYKVVLRTDMEAKFVAGIFNNGRVYYPWLWTVYGEDLAVGPWDCAGLTPEECCQDIQKDVSDPNDAGDFMACFVEEPVGTEKNPERDDRAIAVVNADMRVLRPPIAH